MLNSAEHAIYAALNLECHIGKIVRLSKGYIVDLDGKFSVILL